VFVAIGTIGYVQLTPGPLSASQSDGETGLDNWPGHASDVVFSAPGVTEPSSRTLKIFSEIPGTIRAVHVKSGDRVAGGQLLFELANETQVAEVMHRQSLVRRAKAELAKLESWMRPEDRRIAEAHWHETRAMAELANFEKKQIEELAQQGAASDMELIHARENHAAARARADAAKAAYDRTTAGPSVEELEVARAAVAESEMHLKIAETHLAKTRVLSPIDGMVIYRHSEPGEVVLPDVPKPVVSIGNRDRLHIRADVDETDLGRVNVGQRVFATAEAFGPKRFTGTVVHVEQTLGRKNLYTYRPTEKADTKILEVVIALDDGSELPIDLQMTVWFQHNADTPATQPAG
jgi:multidrug resistance efflux pump